MIRRSPIPRVAGLLAIGLGCLLLTGCPLFDLFKPAEYRSADVGNLNNSRHDFIGGVAGPPELDVEEVRAVEEPDIFRVQGDTLFILNHYRGLITVDLNTMTELAAVPTIGMPRDLYIVGDRAFVLVSRALELRVDDGLLRHDIASRLHVVDIADPARPVLLGSAEIGGNIFDSRLVGDILYAVGAEVEWNFPGGGVVFKRQVGETFVTSFDISVPGAIAARDQLVFDTPADLIHVTPDALFAAAVDAGDTRIQFVDISDPGGSMHPRGTVVVEGRLPDRFKMDAHDGHLRVVSRSGNWQDSRIWISTVPLADPDNLFVLAQREFITAQGDQLFATRFEGDRAYVVTYFIVDPLYVVDLSDPADPRIEGELEVPGWSTHIEPRGDRLIAVGVDDTDGRRASVSLFDVSDPTAPGLVERVSFGENWSWSTANQDVKAFSVVGDRILVPFSGWSAEGGYDRLQFIQWSPDALTMQGAVDVEGAVLRSFDHADRVMSLTSTQLAAINADDPNAPFVTDSLRVAENVVDVVAAANGALAKIIVPYTGDGASISMKNGGRVRAAIGWFEDALAHGNTVIAVGTDYDESGGVYRVAFVDASNPAEPVLERVLTVPLEPSYHHWWWGPGIGMPEVMKGEKFSIAPGWWWPWWGGRRALHTGDYLSLRGLAKDAREWSDPIGGGGAEHGLAVIDLRTQEIARTIGLGYDRVESIDEGGDRLFLTTARTEGATIGRPMVSYFLRTIDPATGQTGSAANVPGSFVQYDDARDLLLLQDYQWASSGRVDRYVRTMAWNDGDQPRLLDSLAVPEAVLQTVAAGNRVYLDLLDNRGYSIQSVGIGANGNLSAQDPLYTGLDFGWIIGADRADVLISAGFEGVAWYDFDAPTPLQGAQAIMGHASNATWTSTQALVPLGYSGYLVLER